MAEAERKVDAQGYLLDWRQWDDAFALHSALQEEIALGDDHWTVLRFLRGFYADYGISPPMRVLVKSIAPLLGGAASSRRLYQLFPQGPARQACKIAGLPKPESCI